MDAAPPQLSVKFTAAMGTLDDQKLKRLYVQVLQCRMLAERAGPRLNRHAGDYAFTPGEEVIVAGALSHLLPEDCVASSRRDLLCSFVKGTPLKDLFRQLRRRTATPARRSSALQEFRPSEVNVIAPPEAGPEGHIESF